MKTITLILFTVFSFHCFAQSYIPIPYTNAKFHTYQYIGYLPCQVQYYYKYLNDTTVGVNIYQVLETQKFGSDPPYCTFPVIFKSLFRNDSLNKKVYFYSNFQEYLNYDFSLLPGDTTFALHDGYNNIQGSPTLLFSIDSILLNGVWHRRFNFKQYQGANPTYTHTLIEGIGATYLHYFENATSLECFSVNNNIIYGAGLCEFAVGVIDQSQNEPQIYADDLIHIKGFSGELSVFDLQGKLCLKTVVNENYHSTNHFLNKGIYIIRLSNKENVIVKKISMN